METLIVSVPAGVDVFVDTPSGVVQPQNVYTAVYTNAGGLVLLNEAEELIVSYAEHLWYTMSIDTDPDRWVGTDAGSDGEAEPTKKPRKRAAKKTSPPKAAPVPNPPTDERADGPVDE